VTSARKWDRTPGADPVTQMANSWGTVFPTRQGGCKRLAQRLSELSILRWWCTAVATVLPCRHGEALARESAGARLLVLEQAATAIPDAAAGDVSGDARVVTVWRDWFHLTRWGGAKTVSPTDHVLRLPFPSTPPRRSIQEKKCGGGGGGKGCVLWD